MTIGYQSTIFARQICPQVWSLSTASSSLRLATLNRMFVRSCIPQTRTRKSAEKAPSKSKCQI